MQDYHQTIEQHFPDEGLKSIIADLGVLLPRIGWSDPFKYLQMIR